MYDFYVRTRIELLYMTSLFPHRRKRKHLAYAETSVMTNARIVK